MFIIKAEITTTSRRTFTHNVMFKASSLTEAKRKFWQLIERCKAIADAKIV